MYRLVIIALLFASFAKGQTKKPAPTSKPKPKVAAAAKDTVAADTMPAPKEVEAALPREFKVYSRRPRNKTEKMKLCLNLVSDDNVLNYCVNDSICKDPEVSRVMFNKQQGDSTYLLVYVQAFSKAADKPECDAGKEVKLFFVRWNTKTNKAIVRQKNVESCMRVITNMTQQPINSWDGVSVLTVSYHRGGSEFSEVKFDPQNYLLGLQSSNDGDPK